jgi:hypothetical protein
VSCGGASAIATPPEYAPPGQTKCSIAATSTKPLIVEWPSADRLELESRVKAGTVVVAYKGCEMRLLSRCRAPGAYVYVAGTPKMDSVVIRDADELYATLPAGAARLESRLQKSGQLNVAMTLIGRYESQKAEVNGAELAGDCGDATHVVSALTVGAFEFFAGADASVHAGAGLGNAEVGAGSSQLRESLTKDGDPAACSSDELSPASPPRGCSALIRLEVMPVAMRSVVAPPPVPSAVPVAVAPLPPPAAPAAPPAGPPPPSPAQDRDSSESGDPNGFLPDPLGFQAAMMIGMAPKYRASSTGKCDRVNETSEGGVAVGLTAGAHWDLSRKISINGNGEIAGEFFGTSLTTVYQISKAFSATGGLGVQWLSFESPEVMCDNGETVKPFGDADDTASFIPVGLLEGGMRWHWAGNAPNASGWLGAVIRGGVGLAKPRDPEEVGSAYAESPPGVSFYGLFGSNF